MLLNGKLVMRLGMRCGVIVMFICRMRIMRGRGNGSRGGCHAHSAHVAACSFRFVAAVPQTAKQTIKRDSVFFP